MKDVELYFTLKEAAKEAGRTTRTLRNWIQAGYLDQENGFKNGRPRLLVLKEDLKSLLR